MTDPALICVYYRCRDLGETIAVSGFAGRLRIDLPIDLADDLRRALAMALELEPVDDAWLRARPFEITWFRPFASLVLGFGEGQDAMPYGYRIEIPRTRAHDLHDQLADALATPRRARGMAATPDHAAQPYDAMGDHAATGLETYETPDDREQGPEVND